MSHTDLVGEVLFVIEEALGPVHQGIDVLWRGELRGSFVLDAVLPQVLESVQITMRALIVGEDPEEYLGPADMIGH